MDAEFVTQETIKKANKNLRFRRIVERLKLNFKIFGIGRETIVPFLEGINPVLIFNLIIPMIATWLCRTYEIEFDFPWSVFIPGISLLSAFLINLDFDRRDVAMRFIAQFKSNCLYLFLVCREWTRLFKIKNDIFFDLSNKIILLCVHLREYLQTTNPDQRSHITKIMYENFSDIDIIIQTYTHDRTNTEVSICTVYVTEIVQNIHNNFEKLITMREYRSPYSAQAFLKISLLIWPWLLAPSYVYMANTVSHTSSYTAYFISFIVSLINNQLQIVEDRLFDPFMGINCDDIKFDDIEIWLNQAIKNIAYRQVYFKNGQCFIHKPNEAEMELAVSFLNVEKPANTKNNKNDVTGL